tara:strand:+ start:57493 stop:58083 length:591 start_codon:yes stop_codon:yes gene_type:complete
MPKYGPQPNQFSQASATRPGQAISSQLAGSTNPDVASPDWDSPGAEVLLGPGVFGNPTAQISGDSVFPDLVGDFEAYDRVEAFSDSQSIDIAWSGRLSDKQERIFKIRMNVVGDSNGSPTTPPTFVIKVYAEGATTANPIFESAVLDAPSVSTEFSIDEVSLTAQPINQKRYHVVVECSLDDGQILDCSRPFVTQE